MANTTWNPSDKDAAVTLSGGNLIATTSANGGVRAVDKQITGKFYWEITATTFASNTSGVGISAPGASWTNGFLGTQTPLTCGVLRNGQIYAAGNTVGITFGTITSATVICIAYDAATRLIWFRLGAAGNWNNNATYNPATGVGGVNSLLGLGIPAYPAFNGQANLESVTANFGDTAFTGAVPAGFTSGFTSGVTSPTNALASQSALEHFYATNPDAQITQTAVEMWATTATVTGQAMVTQVALEMWAPNPVVVSTTQARVMIFP